MDPMSPTVVSVQDWFDFFKEHYTVVFVLNEHRKLKFVQNLWLTEGKFTSREKKQNSKKIYIYMHLSSLLNR